ncbi:ErfK/YbiS/YcfS/YnhG family protein [Methylocella tundrae]|uniref:ErfK/YbiS/YcfS/YnhG family protein n=1 Tax=Methylocella tundrae TaxID=227605 RepID=A0A8B6MD99_METTU|nr:ErfK/YbiS/YcfS/YnhG family protein [Methylocella tundrae]
MRRQIGTASLTSASALALMIALVAAPVRAANADAAGGVAAPVNLHVQGQSSGEAVSQPSRRRAKPAFLARSAAWRIAKKPAPEAFAALAQVKRLPLPAVDSPQPPAAPEYDDQPAPVIPALPESMNPAQAAPTEGPGDAQGAPDATEMTGPPPAADAAPVPADTPAPAGPVAAPPLAPLNAAVKAALEAQLKLDRDHFPGASRRREHEAVAAFYAARDFAPLWSHAGAADAEVASTLQRLDRASEDALTIKSLPVRYTASGSDEEVANADIALSEAVVAYGRQASGSRVDPHAISPLIGARPELADPSLILAIVSSSGADAGAALKNFNPPQKGYAALRAKLAELRGQRAPVARRAIIPAGPTLKVGMRDPRVPLIRARLSLDGEMEEPDEELVYDTRVASAVADFQKANGLPGSGRLTARTIALLSGGEPAQLEAEIIANMERWRWMPRDMGDSRIEVNIPDFEVTVIENGEVVSRNRVVVGKEATPTPIFSNKMQFLIVNPYWNVPQSIIKKEMMPKLAANPGYLHSLGYETIWKGGRLTVRQPPGERNALGRIKFMFPNDYAVYLHDTPSRALFDTAKRAYSHGCVRVDDPFRFAEAVLGKGWSEDHVKKLIGGKERYVNLAKPLPIHIEYFTAEVDEFGRLQLRDDVYGYSHKVKAALGLEG